MAEIDTKPRGALTPRLDPETVERVAARVFGGMTYDYALPIEWLRRFEKLTGLDPRGHFVWLYPKGSMAGIPGPITVEGLAALVNLGGPRLYSDTSR